MVEEQKSWTEEQRDKEMEATRAVKKDILAFAESLAASAKEVISAFGHVEPKKKVYEFEMYEKRILSALQFIQDQAHNEADTRMSTYENNSTKYFSKKYVATGNDRVAIISQANRELQSARTSREDVFEIIRADIDRSTKRLTSHLGSVTRESRKEHVKDALLTGLKAGHETVVLVTNSHFGTGLALEIIQLIDEVKKVIDPQALRGAAIGIANGMHAFDIAQEALTTAMTAIYRIPVEVKEKTGAPKGPSTEEEAQAAYVQAKAAYDAKLYAKGPSV